MNASDWDENEPSEEALSHLAGVLRSRADWAEIEFGAWEFLPSVPPSPGKPKRASLWRCMGTVIDPREICVFPPGVRLGDEDLDDEYSHRPDMAAQEITGIAPPPYTGEITAVYYDDLTRLEAALDEIEQWRWPDRLPPREFPGAEDSWESGPPHDLDEVIKALDVRPGWKRFNEVGASESLTFLWPSWVFEPPNAKRGQVTTIRVAEEAGFRVWAPSDSRAHLLFGEAAQLLEVLDAIESWRNNRLPRWATRTERMLAIPCPRCQQGPRQPCARTGPRTYAGMLHIERVPVDARGHQTPPVTTAAWAKPVCGQRPAGGRRGASRRK